MTDYADNLLPAGNTLPKIQPLPLRTVGRPAWKKVVIWRSHPRRFVLLEDWFFRMPNGRKICVPKGFETDFSSIPKALQIIDNPIGLSLCAGLIHDVAYADRQLLDAHKNPIGEPMSRFEADDLFKRVFIATNDTILIALFMYWALRLFGRFAWNRHRKAEAALV